MNWKDRISIVVSLTALLVSGTSSYFTFFRVDTTVNCAVLGVNIDPANNAAKANVAVLNTGNRQVALTGAYIYLIQLDESETLRQPMKTTASPAKYEFPVLIEPGKLVLFDIGADVPWDSVIGYRQPVEAGDDHTHKTIMGVHIDGLSATGARLVGTNDAIEIQLRETSYGGRSVVSDVKPFAPIR